jgi:hypothetical protein
MVRKDGWKLNFPNQIESFFVTFKQLMLVMTGKMNLLIFYTRCALLVVFLKTTETLLSSIEIDTLS